ncbi:MAG: hypothetical protein OQK98_10560 [Gammaproteobacteria bacterium]|nr:hypothetical protein [Gammaproteobacteria bacterium]
MEIVLLILAILIFGKTTKQVERVEVKLIAGSVLGISYFVIWPYVFYYAQLLNWSKTYIQVSFVVMVAVSLLLARALVEIKLYEVIQIVTIGLFLILWTLSSIFDIPIKDKIADYSGFFSGSLVSSYDKTELLTKKINSPTNAYSVLIPEHWKEQKHTGTDLPFYTAENTTSSIIEFRPGCNNKQKYSTSKIIEGMSSIHQENQTSSYQCYNWNEHDYACRVKISDDSGITRVRWIGANKETNYLLELDFVMQNGNQRDLKLTESIFKTARYNEVADKTANCVTPIEWF